MFWSTHIYWLWSEMLITYDQEVLFLNKPRFYLVDFIYNQTYNLRMKHSLLLCCILCIYQTLVWSAPTSNRCLTFNYVFLYVGLVSINLTIKCFSWCFTRNSIKRSICRKNIQLANTTESFYCSPYICLWNLFQLSVNEWV